MDQKIRIKNLSISKQIEKQAKNMHMHILNTI